MLYCYALFIIMVTWNFLFNEQDFENYCDTLRHNCVAKLFYQGVNYPGFIQVEERLAYFYYFPEELVVTKRYGFYALEDEGELEWIEHFQGDPIPPNALSANPHLENQRLYFGFMDLEYEARFGPVLDDGNCYIPFFQDVTQITPEAILVWKTNSDGSFVCGEQKLRCTFGINITIFIHFP
ncbi:Hypothetical predicted protein [Cloeon dipterum]|uniref:Uncharacterized protein n=1 Tax=Cloeon dipterum TaxID=197152 RepID=A0A8S1DXU6_9INSE|nr:Hypothetical predicted protein [Cloeon dipterum]